MKLMKIFLSTGIILITAGSCADQKGPNTYNDHENSELNSNKPDSIPTKKDSIYNVQ